MLQKHYLCRKPLAGLLVLFAMTGSTVGISETDETTDNGSSVVVFGSTQFWGQIVAIIALVVCSGIVAGLTLGLMSLDVTNLSILTVAGTPQQKEHAAKIMPIRKNGHLVLTALLLTNTVLNETLPVLCDGLFGKGYIAIILSTALIVLFSEIIPQAVCSRNGLAIGAFFALPVKGLIGFWFIIAWPIAKVLDMLLGKHRGIMYIVPELVELVGLHSKAAEPKGPIEPQTIDILQHILLLSQKSAGDFSSCNNATSPFMLHADTYLDKPLMDRILKSGCTAVPVYEDRMTTLSSSNNADEKHTVASYSAVLLGILRISTLANALIEKSILPVRDFDLDPILHVPSTVPAISMLQILQNEPSHLVQVVNNEVHLHPEEESTYDGDRAGSSVLESKPTTIAAGMGIVSLQDILVYLLKSTTGPEDDTCVVIDNSLWKHESQVARTSTSFSNSSSATAISK